MTFLEKIEVIDRVDRLIRRKATGTADELASRLGLSRSTVFEILNCMKAMGAKIEYCTNRKSYHYTESCDLVIGFLPKDEIKGGTSNIYYDIYSSPIFSDYSALSLHQNHI